MDERGDPVVIDWRAPVAEPFADFRRRSLDERDAFWAEQARLVDWQRPFDSVCDASRPPFTRWFVGGKTNLCHNAVDRHLKDRADQPGHPPPVAPGGAG